VRTVIAISILAALETSAVAEPSAEQLFTEGQQAFDRGDYRTAVARWQESYDLSKLPLLVFNIAQAYRLAADCEHSLAAYRRYVALDPASEQRGLAEEFIATLEPQCGSPRSPSVQQKTVVESTRPGRNLRVAGVVAGGAGAAAIAGGLLLGKHASTLGDEVTAACAVSCDWSAQKDKDAAGRRDATLGRIFDGVGMTAMAAGVTLYVLGVRRSERTLLVQPTPGGASVTWGGSW
jgi:hypothetical protein